MGKARHLPERARAGAGFAALLLAVFLGAFTAVFLWGDAGRPAVAGSGIEPLELPDAPSAEELLRERWPHTAEAIEADQPQFGAEPAAAHSTGQAVNARFTRCGAGPRVTCVVDGDTIWLRGAKIRMADYNTPEIGNPGCARERVLGERAASRLLALLNSGSVALRPNPDGRATDRYGRGLRIVTVGGASVGDTLVAEGLAHPWNGSRRSWC